MSAIYGVGIYGTAQYGVVQASVTVSVTGVSSNFILNDTLEIDAEALHFIDTPNTDTLNVSLGVLSVSGKAIVIPTGAEVTGSIGTIIQRTNNTISVTGIFSTPAIGDIALETNNYIDVTGIQVVSFVNTVSVVAFATVPITGVFATGAVGTVNIFENELIVSPTNIAVLTVGVLTVNTTVFNFNAVASQYSRNRTAYVPRKPTSQERTVIIPAGQ